VDNFGKKFAVVAAAAAAAVLTPSGLALYGSQMAVVVVRHQH
jgi:hypothetical protein